MHKGSASMINKSIMHISDSFINIGVHFVHSMYNMIHFIDIFFILFIKIIILFMNYMGEISTYKACAVIKIDWLIVACFNPVLTITQPYNGG